MENGIEKDWWLGRTSRDGCSEGDDASHDISNLVHKERQKFVANRLLKKKERWKVY